MLKITVSFFAVLNSLLLGVYYVSLHCPHKFLWWLKVLLHFVPLHKLPVNVQKYK